MAVLLMVLDLLKKKTYLDYSATTPVHPRVRKTISRYLSKRYANPSSVHDSGMVAKASVERARESIAKTLHCSSEHLIFTGSGSEANNLAVLGFFEQQVSALEGSDQQLSNYHLITSWTEHSSILQPIGNLKAKGLHVSYVRVDTNGHYDLNHLNSLIQTNTAMIALSYVNSEIGTIQDVTHLQEIASRHQIHLHIDAVQALPYIDIDLKVLALDSMSFSGHKINGPKGIGLLFQRSASHLKPLIFGGGQERGLRSGTENVPYIMGLAEAFRINYQSKHLRRTKVLSLQQFMLNRVLLEIPDVKLTGDPKHRSPHHISLAFKDINGKGLVDLLSQSGFETSSGTACTSNRQGPSKVLESIHLDPEYLMGSLRISLAPNTKKGEIQRFIKVLISSVLSLRSKASNPLATLNLMTQAEFEARLKNNPNTLQVLNVSPNPVAETRIPNLIYAPPWKLEGIAKKLDKNKETLVICQHGDILGPRSARRLIRKGFSAVYSLQGGFSAMQAG